jgi:Glu-tRNA(Gln) amidotransferase subunit E-like FAD-binding protein
VAGLDQPPLLLHSEAWPRSDGGADELAALRRTLGCEAEDALVVVWGCEDDTVTAADEIRIRLVDATDGVPNETRQPFADGSTDFERILPGPDRMYPDTDHPPEPIVRDRVERLQVALPEPPWEREARYAAAGVPTDTIRWLIRRNGARLVDLVVNEAGADLRRAAFFFGERVKGWRRAGVAVDAVTDDQWISLFRLFRDEPLAWDRRDDLVRWLADRPGQGAEAAAREMELGASPAGWRDRVRGVVRNAELDGRDRSPDRRARLALGLALDGLRGRVAVADVAGEVAAARTAELPAPVE